ASTCETMLVARKTPPPTLEKFVPSQRMMLFDSTIGLFGSSGSASKEENRPAKYTSPLYSAISMITGATRPLNSLDQTVQVVPSQVAKVGFCTMPPPSM